MLKVSFEKERENEAQDMANDLYLKALMLGFLGDGAVPGDGSSHYNEIPLTFLDHRESGMEITGKFEVSIKFIDYGEQKIGEDEE